MIIDLKQRNLLFPLIKWPNSSKIKYKPRSNSYYPQVIILDRDSSQGDSVTATTIHFQVSTLWQYTAHYTKHSCDHCQVIWKYSSNRYSLPLVSCLKESLEQLVGTGLQEYIKNWQQPSKSIQNNQIQIIKECCSTGQLINLGLVQQQSGTASLTLDSMLKEILGGRQLTVFRSVRMRLSWIS